MPHDAPSRTGVQSLYQTGVSADNHGVKRTAYCSLLGLVAAALVAVPAQAVRPPNHIQIVAPAPVQSQQVYDLTLRGFARRRATAYLFVDYAGCAASFAAEARRQPHAVDSYPVIGSFAEVSGWKSSSPGSDHACAYLVARSRAQLASDRIAFPIR
jgi:hypothetical protein